MAPLDSGIRGMSAEMENGSALTLLVVVRGSWCFSDDSRAKRVTVRSQLPICDRRTPITTPSSDAIVKFRDRNRRLRLDGDARIVVADAGKVYLQSADLAKDLASCYDHDTLVYIFLEQVDDVVRATIHFSNEAELVGLAEERPELRINTFDLPPYSVTEIEPSYSDDGSTMAGIYDYLLSEAQKADRALFSTQTDSFLILLRHRIG